MDKTLPIKLESLEASIIQSIGSSGIIDLSVDLAEVGLDQLLSDGIIRDVPIFGTLVKLRSTIGIVRDLLFAKKVAKFLMGVAKIDTDERRKFIDDIKSRNEDKRLGETLILLLDRLDDYEKPEILARMFQAYVKGKCDLPMFRRLAAVVDQLPLQSIGDLQSFYAPTKKGLENRRRVFVSICSDRACNN